MADERRKLTAREHQWLTFGLTALTLAVLWLLYVAGAFGDTTGPAAVAGFRTMGVVCPFLALAMVAGASILGLAIEGLEARAKALEKRAADLEAALRAVDADPLLRAIRAKLAAKGLLGPGEGDRGPGE
jgi:hypothetical protein